MSRSEGSSNGSPNGSFYRPRPFGTGAYRYTSKSSSAFQGRNQSPIYNLTNHKGMSSTMTNGVAFGTVNSLAHHTLGSFFGNRYYMQTNPNGEIMSINRGITTNNKEANPCYEDSRRFEECITQVYDLTKCQNIFDELKNCEKAYMH
jgi:hypothetical protein